MPVLSPGTYDQAQQSTVLAIKAKTDFVNNRYVYHQLLPRRGRAVQGTWLYGVDAGATEWLTDLKLDAAGYWYNQTGAINDEYAYPLFLPAGNYSLEIHHVKSTDQGILTARFGAMLLGTIDTYAGALTYNNINTISFTVAADTANALRLVAESKNGASTAYRLLIQKATLWRTS